MRQQQDATKKRGATKLPPRLIEQGSESEDSVKESRFVSKTEFDEAMESFDESMKLMQTTINERQEQMAQKLAQQQEENNAKILQQQEENNAKILQQQEEILSHMNAQNESLLEIIREFKSKVGTSFREIDQVASEQSNAYSQLVSEMQGISQSILTIQHQLHSLESTNQAKAKRDESQDSPIFLNSDANSRKTPFSRQLNQSSSSAQLADITFSFPENEEGTGRDSVYGSLLAGDIELQASRDRERRLTVDSDKHMFIKWKVRTLDAFLVFLNQINLFQKAYQQVVPYLYTHFSREIQLEVKSLLIMTQPTKYLDANDASRANLQDIYQVVQHMFSPLDLQSFNQMLYESCKPYQPFFHPSDFKKTKTAIYNMKDIFMERYKFLVAAAKRTNNAGALPAFTFKQGGLFHTWLQLNPFELRESFQEHLERVKYDSMEKFFTSYLEYLDDTHLKSEQARLLDSRIRRFSANKNRYSQPRWKNGQSESSQYSDRAPREHREDDTPFVRALNEDTDDNMETEWNMEYDQEEEFFAMEDYARSLNGRYPDSNSRRHFDHSSSNRNSQRRFDQPYKEVRGAMKSDGDKRTWQPNQRNPNRDEESRTRNEQHPQKINALCKKLLYENQCTYSPCPYVHTMSLIREERDKIMNQWQLPRPIRELRTRPPPPGRPPDGLKAVNLIQPEQPAEDEEDDQEDSQLYQVQALM